MNSILCTIGSQKKLNLPLMMLVISSCFVAPVGVSLVCRNLSPHTGTLPFSQRVLISWKEQTPRHIKSWAFFCYRTTLLSKKFWNIYNFNSNWFTLIQHMMLNTQWNWQVQWFLHFMGTSSDRIWSSIDDGLQSKSRNVNTRIENTRKVSLATSFQMEGNS